MACVWRVEDGAGPVPPAARAILPDGTVDLVWHAGTLTVAGPDTRARPAGPGGALGVRLRPGAAASFGPSGAALRDEHPAVADVWGAEGRRLEDQVAFAADARERFALLLRAVARRSADAPPTDPAVDHVVALLGRAAGPGVAAAAREAGVGERLLRRRFAQHVGYGPKTLDRVLRLQRLLRLATSTDDGLAGLAYRAGYADQAHLARETRALANATPSALVAARRPALPATPFRAPRAAPRAGSGSAARASTPQVSETSKTPGDAVGRMGT